MNVVMRLFTGGFALLLLTGCPPEQREVPMAVSNEWSYLDPQPGPGLVANPDSPIADVPTPVGFVPLANQSSSTISADGSRYVNHVYQGRSNLQDVQRFYEQQLRLHEWSDIVVKDASQNTLIIEATKGREQMNIAARHRNSLVTLTIDILPN